VTTYLLDSTLLIDWLRGWQDVVDVMLRLVDRGHVLGTSCVNLAEIEAGLRQHERRRASALLDRLRLLPTDREAAHRAGRYQADWARKGRRIQTPDALVAGTARANGAVLVTHNIDDFPMGDLRVQHPDEIGA
jgi:predicted nucleic acid-binding protein